MSRVPCGVFAQGAQLPAYSPAALALAQSQKEVQGIVLHEVQRKTAASSGKDKTADDMAGGTSLTKKQVWDTLSSRKEHAHARLPYPYYRGQI